ncbi:MAG TPA: TVP38/TMEM64 family protein [Chthoniobacterales bacterium]
MNPIRRSALWFQGGALCLGISVVATVSWQFPVMTWIATAQKATEHLGTRGLFIYPLLCAVCNVLLLPGGILSAGAGMLFGLWKGFLVVLAGNILAAAASFGIGRLVGRAWIEKYLLRNPKWRTIDTQIARSNGRIVFLTQLHPLFPTSLFNYLYGVTRMKFWPCMGWTVLGRTPGLFLYAYLGTLGKHGFQVLKGQTNPSLHEYVFWLGGFAVTVAIAVALARLARNMLKEME